MNYNFYFPYIAAFVIAIPFLVYFRHFVYSYIRLKENELKLLDRKQSKDKRTNAYERMTLFLERLKPSNLVSKFDRNLAPHEFIFLLEKTVTEEFEYNASQQLYISKISWQNIVNAKNGIIMLAHKTYENTNGSVTLEEFKTLFLMNYINGEDYISQTLEDLRKEMLIINN